VKTAKELYPNCECKYYEDDEETYFSHPFDYSPIIENIGNVIIRVKDKDYQGSTRLLLEKDECYAIFVYRWGSCSGCDTLQACKSYENVQKIMDNFNKRVEWKNKEEIVSQIKSEWLNKENLDWHEEEELDFISQLKEWVG
jgi:hypothetical protein